VEIKDGRMTDIMSIRFDEPAPELPGDTQVAIVVLEDASSIQAWSCPEHYTAAEKIAFLHYIYSFMCTNLFINAHHVCESAETSKLFVRALQWLILAVNDLDDAAFFGTISLLNQRLEPLRASILQGVFTGDTLMAGEIQEELLAVARLFESLKKQADDLPVQRRTGNQEVYFRRLEEIRTDRLNHIANRDDLCQALDLASSLDLAGIEVGFFKEVLAASLVRGRTGHKS
jgi:hypothetical protein